MNERIKKLMSHCKKCINKPCQLGCPLNNDIPTIISYMEKKEYEKAYEILCETTILGSICGRVCPKVRQCQGSCSKTINRRAVRIGEIESFLSDMALKNNWKLKKKRDKNYNVAIVGGGPAGLTCAYFLRKNGIKVTIYEKKDKLGGLLTYGIPDFRLSKKIVDKSIENILSLGIDVKYNMELGKNVTLSTLKRNYDAVFIGIGANCSNKVNLPGENLVGVYGANEVLEDPSDIDFSNKTIAVLGGGDVAMDMALTAKKMGAKKVMIIYRRSEKELPALKEDIKIVKKNGIKFLFRTNINKFIGNKKLEKLEIVKTRLRQREGDSRLFPYVVKGSNRIISADYCFLALGSHNDECVSTLKLKLDEMNKIDIDNYGKTSDKKVFAAGDVAGVKSTVAWASKSGRNAAESILKYLENE